MDDPFTMEARLCDDAGMVSHEPVTPANAFAPGLTYIGQLNNLRAQTPPRGEHRPVDEPFPCTGSAHLARNHIRCTSPAHARVPQGSAFGGTAVFTTVPVQQSTTVPLSPWTLTTSAVPCSAPPVPSEHDLPVGALRRINALVDTLERVEKWLQDPAITKAVIVDADATNIVSDALRLTGAALYGFKVQYGERLGHGPDREDELPDFLLRADGD